MKLEIAFAEETRFDLPLRQAGRTKVPSFFGLVRRAWPRTSFLQSRLRRIIIKQGKAMEIPEGFQTAIGFHLGVEPSE